MNFKNFPTPQIMVYAELTTTQLDELDKYGMDIALCESYGGITKAEMKELHEKLSIKMLKIEESRIALLKEINSRMRRDLNVSFGPSDVQPYLNKIQTKFPLIGKGEAEVKAFLAKKEKETADAKLVKA